MTHLSDYSYLDRLVSNVFFFIFIVWYVIIIQKGQKGFLSSLKKQQGALLRFVIFLFYCFSYISIIVYDILATKLKYDEGFVDTCLLKHHINDTADTAEVAKHVGDIFNPEIQKTHTFIYKGPSDINYSLTDDSGCGIMQTPANLYDHNNLRILTSIDALFNLSCTLRNSALFLLLAWFNTSIGSFFCRLILSTWEVRLCASYSLFSLIWYFVLPTFFSDPLKSTISTQMLWSIELYVASILLFVTNLRVKDLIHKRSTSIIITSSTKEDHTSRALKYALTLNAFLAFCLIFESSALLVLNLDILLANKVIYASKLLTDIFTRVFNFFFVIEPLIVILILYKPSVALLVINPSYDSRSFENENESKRNTNEGISLTLQPSRSMIFETSVVVSPDSTKSEKSEMKDCKKIIEKPVDDDDCENKIKDIAIL